MLKKIKDSMIFHLTCAEALNDKSLKDVYFTIKFSKYKKEGKKLNTLGIITARSGSKGINDKNIRLLDGKPLIAYTIESALKSTNINEVMVSTDSEKYAEIAKTYGAKVPFLRSQDNAADAARSIDVLFEVLDQYKKLGICYDTVILLQPTSPLRTVENIDNAFRLFYEKNADSVVSVCECEHSPLLSNILKEDLSLSGFIKSADNCRRQSMKKYYRVNGAIYISKENVLREIQSFYGRNSYAYIMEQRESIDIDTEMDFEYAEFIMKRKERSMNGIL